MIPMRNIRIALYVCLAGLLATACQKEKIEEQLPLKEYTTNIFKLKSAPLTDDNNGQKVYLQFGESSSSLFYEDGDKIKICSDLGDKGDFVIKHRTPSDGQSPTVTEEGWYAQGSAELTGNTFYAAYVDGYKDNSSNLTGDGPSYSFNINSIYDNDDYNKVILAGNTATNTDGTLLSLEPMCAILRLNTQGAGGSYTYVKVGFEANKVPKTGTVDASAKTLSAENYNCLAGVTSGGAGEFLYMRYSSRSAGEGDYWYVAIPIRGTSVSTYLYLEWNNGSGVTQYRTSGEVTLQRGRVYTVGTERTTPFHVYGFCKSQFSVSGSQKVFFSAGNLQAKRYFDVDAFATKNAWQFSSAQTLALKDLNTRCGQEDVWLDLFGYGTSGNTVHPNDSSTSSAHYPSSNIAATNNDWGVNNWSSPGIIFGQNTVTNIQWRTLTKDEWEYLIGRTGKNGLATITIDGMEYKGLVLLPDATQSGGTWTKPSEVSFTAGFSSYSLNQYTAEQWSVLEYAGAVFLPVTNKRSRITMEGVDEGYYWTSTYKGGMGTPSYALKISEGSVSVVAQSRPTGCAVRLVVNR